MKTCRCCHADFTKMREEIERRVNTIAELRSEIARLAAVIDACFSGECSLKPRKGE